jgi:hypothetical protein
MFARIRFKKFLRLRSVGVAVLVGLTICAGLFVYAKNRSSKDPFELAADFPRGPLVYAQFADLPSLIKQWDQSPLKRQYLESANFRQFQHGHLALKLLERWEEFNNALGFPLDAATLSDSADARVGLAIYDIGRLDLVFIAPLSEEKVMATAFFKSKDQFEATELSDGTTYYHHEVEADRGRQKQVLVFAAVKGRLILATSEPLLLRTIANLNRKSLKDSLADDPSFKSLTAGVSPHFATVWVDQAKLNDDYYFKHYWLMQNVDQLKSIRACLFDLELQDGVWIERRDFLSNNQSRPSGPAIPAVEVARLQAQIPTAAPFLKVESLAGNPALTMSLIHDTLLERQAPQPKPGGKYWSWQRYGDDEFYPVDGDDEGGDYHRYSYLSPEYDSTIDDPLDARTSRTETPGANPLRNELEQQFAERLQAAIAPAQPLAAVSAASPRTIAGPLFVEFRRVAILTLQSPAGLNRELLETAIAKAAQSRLTVAGPSVDLKWVGHSENDQSWRELELPLLGWHFCYVLRGRELIVANSSEFLREVMATKPRAAIAERSAPALDNLTIIRLEQRKSAFDDIVDRLDAKRKKPAEPVRDQNTVHDQNNSDSAAKAEEFFSGNIASLLDVAANVSRIEIKRNSAANHLHEELYFVLK